MKLGIVTGTVVSTRKVENVTGLKLLVVNLLNADLADSGKAVVCTDTVNAGSGDVVLLCASSSARMTDATRTAATDNTIVGIVDAVASGSTPLYTKNGVA
jgi:microcompartment protein CcmK/EutM